MPNLIFPENPANGEIYPPFKIAGTNQYIWNASSNTWEILSLVGQYIEKSIITEKGDIIVGESAANPDILPAGENGQVLTVDSSEPLGLKWDYSSGSGIPLSTVNDKGDLIVGQSDEEVSALPLGAEGQVLTVSAGETLGVKWDYPPSSGIPLSLIGAKGDLIVGQGAEEVSALPVGGNSYVLTADDTEPLGIKWAPSSGGGGGQISVVEYTTSTVSAGGHEDFFLDMGDFFTLFSVAVTPLTPPASAWVRVYTSASGRNSDIRIIPGPPFPNELSGFITEFTCSSSDNLVKFIPSPTFESEGGVFFRVVNLGQLPNSFEFTIKAITGP